MARRVSFMERGLSVANLGARPSSGGGRGLLGIQNDAVDLQEYDSSMGCPLSKYEEATIGLVGGKALQCWRLQKYGLPVPKAFVIPTYVYSVHVGKAGVEDLINEIFISDLRNDAIREVAKEKMAKVGKAIMDTPLSDEVKTNIETFVDTMPGNNTYAVRSSGSAEDLASQSFAGQYDTFLFKSTVEEISESVKACWASMFRSHIVDYIASAADRNPDAYSPDKMKPPRMGVLIMKMVEAEVAGVCFSRNLWGEMDEVMIEAVPGQGEGLVGGEITPDRFVLNKYTGKTIYQAIETQTHKFARTSQKMEGVEKVELSNALTGPVLSAANLKEITRTARSIEAFYNQPQDIEWAIDKDGNIFILQSRPITASSAASLSFIPPGEGFWTFDPTHFPRPLSPWLQACYGFDYAPYHARRMGSMIQQIKFRFVHNFMFSQPEVQPPSDALERAAEAYWSKKLYEDDYREFTDFFRPECEKKQEELRKVNPSSLSYGALASYVARCYDMAREFWRLHHSYTFPAVGAVGDFMNRVAALTGKGPYETLALLEGTSPESRGLLNRKDPLLAKMYDLLTKSESAMALLQNEQDPEWALDCLLHMPDDLGEVMREVRLKYGWRLVGGYDLVVPALVESPDFFLKTLYMGTQEDPLLAEKAEAKVRKMADEWKAKVPEEKHEEFEEALSVGQKFFRMRDERGLCTDLSGIGLCRRGILEGGRRLKDQGVIKEAAHLCVATKDEAMSLLKGRSSGALLGVIEIPTADELERRYDNIFNADPSKVPRTLGTPPPQPDPSQLPPNLGRTLGAIGVCMGGVFDDPPDAIEDIVNSKDKVKGIGTSAGTATGNVCLVLNDDDLKKVKKGDIVVTYSCSASFNVVIGLCAGIVTDYGGMLSHAAIVAREYGIPGVVSSQAATQKFKDGDVITVDTGTGIVSLVSRKEE